MNVFWTDKAFDHLLQIREHLNVTSAVYADRTVGRIIARSEQLETFPLSGRRVPEYARDDLREIQERPYRLIYRAGSERIDVLAVVHAHRSLPSDVGDL